MGKFLLFELKILLFVLFVLLFMGIELLVKLLLFVEDCLFPPLLLL